MTIYRFDDVWGCWRPSTPHMHTGQKWVGAHQPHPGRRHEDPFHPRYIAEGTVWQRDVRGDAMPLAHNSAAMAAWMEASSPDPWNPVAFGQRTSLNTHKFGTAPVATYLVDSTLPGCPTQTMDSCAGAGLTDEQITAYLTGPIPWPRYAVPAHNGDRGFCLIDLGTGIWREYFMVEPVPGKPGHWTAKSGGFAVYLPGFDGLIRSKVYAPQHTAGHGTVFGGFDMLGYIGVEEVLRGQIQHALAFTTANFAATMIPSWPARLSDGKAPLSEASKSPTHGQWARLPATVDPDKDPRTGREYKPLTRLLIRAAQRYGLVATDTNAWCHAFKAWSTPETVAAYGGTDPWAPGGLIAKHLLPWNPMAGLDVSDFPWYLTEWAPVDWGRPSPDFNLRPWEWRPWVYIRDHKHTVTSVLSSTPYSAHRGGSLDYPEMSAYAYQRSATAGWPILELSLGRTKDGVWFGAHDAHLDRVALGTDTTSLPVRTMTWEQVQQHSIRGTTATNNPSQPDQPFARLTDLLGAHSNVVWMIDPKTFIWTQEISELFDMLDKMGGPERFIIKWYGATLGAKPLLEAAAQRNYQRWGFFYASVTTDPALSSWVEQFSILGLNWDAPKDAWDRLRAASGTRPIWAHVCRTTSDVEAARTKGAQGYQCSGVLNIEQLMLREAHRR